MRCLLAEVVPLASGVELWGLLLGKASLESSFLDLQLDISSIAQDRRFLTSIVMLPSNFGGIYGDWLPQWWRPCQEAVPFDLAPPLEVLEYQSPSR